MQRSKNSGTWLSGRRTNSRGGGGISRQLVLQTRVRQRIALNRENRFTKGAAPVTSRILGETASSSETEGRKDVSFKPIYLQAAVPLYRTLTAAVTMARKKRSKLTASKELLAGPRASSQVPHRQAQQLHATGRAVETTVTVAPIEKSAERVAQASPSSLRLPRIPNLRSKKRNTDAFLRYQAAASPIEGYGKIDPIRRPDKVNSPQSLLSTRSLAPVSNGFPSPLGQHVDSTSPQFSGSYLQPYHQAEGNSSHDASSIGTLLIDGTVLGQWLGRQLEQSAMRPMRGPSAVDTRVVPQWGIAKTGY